MLFLSFPMQFNSPHLCLCKSPHRPGNQGDIRHIHALGYHRPYSWSNGLLDNRGRGQRDRGTQSRPYNWHTPPPIRQTRCPRDKVSSGPSSWSWCSREDSSRNPSVPVHSGTCQADTSGSNLARTEFTFTQHQIFVYNHHNCPSAFWHGPASTISYWKEGVAWSMHILFDLINQKVVLHNLRHSSNQPNFVKTVLKWLQILYLVLLPQGIARFHCYKMAI